jgi:predicted  nucleic acid-binding Zn-ribbon protein
MDEAGLEDLRKELATLEGREALISAKRRHLHQQIDFGFASEETRALEREISDERRRLHRRIDALRKLLQLPPARAGSVSVAPADDNLRLEPR